MSEEPMVTQQEMSALLDKCKLYAKEKADRARNEALAVLGFRALIVGLLSAFGINGLITDQVTEALKDSTHTRLIDQLNQDLVKSERVIEDMADSLDAAENTRLKIDNILAQYSREDTNLEIRGDLTVTGNNWGAPLRQIGYGASNHSSVSKTATCPEGYYVVGIEVKYGGTCRTQCRDDGGIVQEIVLSCGAL